MGKLQEAIPSIINLSDLDSLECGCSLVLKLLPEDMPIDRKVIAFLHKMDVFKFELPAELKTTQEYDLFRAFMIQNGERNVTVDLVEKMFTEYEESIRRGRELFDVTLARTDALARSAECIVDEPDFRLFIVEQPADHGPIDLPRYQEVIDEIKNDTPTLVVTRTHSPTPAGVYNLGIRRAGAQPDISKIAGSLKGVHPFISGGGHPFAGGAQSNALVTRKEIATLVAAAAREHLVK